MAILAALRIGQSDKCEILCMACAHDRPAVVFATQSQFVWGHAHGLPKASGMKLNANACAVVDCCHSDVFVIFSHM